MSWRAVRAAAGPGYALVGDAAAILDPASSHGVLKAVLSGIAAAHLIAGALAMGRDEDALARRYARWMADSFKNDAQALQELYSVWK